MDIASINVTNNNNKTIRNVTFKVVLDTLASGNYIANEGRIVKTEVNNDTQIIYVSTDIPPTSSQNIVIRPDTPLKPLNVQFPRFLTEGLIDIIVTDTDGKPIKDAEVIFDTNFYRTGKDGKVTVNAHRGPINIIIQSPGYEKYSQFIEVKGRLSNLF